MRETYLKKTYLKRIYRSLLLCVEKNLFESLEFLSDLEKLKSNLEIFLFKNFSFRRKRFYLLFVNPFFEELLSIKPNILTFFAFVLSSFHSTHKNDTNLKKKT